MHEFCSLIEIDIGVDRRKEFDRNTKTMHEVKATSWPWLN